MNFRYFLVRDLGKSARYSMLVIVICSLGLLGCVVPTAFFPDNYVTEEKFDKPSSLDIKRIAIVDVPPPSKIWLGSPVSGAATGLFGPLVGLGTASHKGTDVFDSSNLSKLIQDELAGWLEKSGVEVTILQAERENEHKMLSDYSQFSEITADVILEVAPMHIGYRERPGAFSKKLSPDIWLVYRMQDVASGEILIQAQVIYSSFDYSDMKHWMATKIQGPTEHIFISKEAVTQQPDEASRRLEFAIEGATKYISEVILN